jgi:scyllo-inositol 2-dehydrogenase (NADP+)
MSTPIITGLLAYGMSGRIFHAPFLTANPGFKLKAVVERHEKKCAVRYPDIVSYNSVEALLNDDEIELVVVNTPSFTHYELAMQALKAGKHVLIEKPIAATGTQVKAIYDLARKVNKHVMVYQNRRWDSDFLSVKEIIESGYISVTTGINHCLALKNLRKKRAYRQVGWYLI